VFKWFVHFNQYFLSIAVKSERDQFSNCVLSNHQNTGNYRAIRLINYELEYLKVKLQFMSYIRNTSWRHEERLFTWRRWHDFDHDLKGTLFSVDSFNCIRLIDRFGNTWYLAVVAVVMVQNNPWIKKKYYRCFLALCLLWMVWILVCILGATKNIYSIAAPCKTTDWLIVCTWYKLSWYMDGRTMGPLNECVVWTGPARPRVYLPSSI